MKFRNMDDYGKFYESSGAYDAKVVKSEIPQGFIPKEAYGDLSRNSFWYVYTTSFTYDYVPKCTPKLRRFAQVELRVILVNETDEQIAYVKYLGVDLRSQFGAIEEAMTYIDDLARSIVHDFNKKDIISALSTMNFYGMISPYNGYSGTIDSQFELVSQIFANYFSSDESKQDNLITEQLTVNRLRKALSFYNGSYMKP